MLSVVALAVFKGTVIHPEDPVLLLAAEVALFQASKPSTLIFPDLAEPIVKLKF